MDADALSYLSLAEVAEQLRQRAVSPVEVLEAVLARTDAVEPRLRAYVTPTFDAARAAARAAEQEIAGGRYRGPLHGIPIALKDNYWTRGVVTAAGAKLLADFVPPEDGTVVAKLRAAGAILTGKTNMHELAIGGSTDNPHYGPTHNPWRLDCIPGGSSGGSAAAVAAGLCYAATGTDTAGSIREPAAYCGLAGLKPTYGRVSIHGIVPLSWSLDHAGPLARTVEDVALVLNAIARLRSARPLLGRRAGRRLFSGAPGRRPARPAARRARAVLLRPARPRGAPRPWRRRSACSATWARTSRRSLPPRRLGGVAVPVMSRPEAASFQEEFLRTRPDDYGDVRAQVELGTMVLATDYLRAQRLRTAMRQEAGGLLTRVDALVTPTTRTVAHPIGRPFTEVAGQPVTPVGLWIGLTLPFDLTGTPGAVGALRLLGRGLPIGLQIVGRSWDEPTSCRIGAAYERATPWHDHHPPL